MESPITERESRAVSLIEIELPEDFPESPLRPITNAQESNEAWVNKYQTKRSNSNSRLHSGISSAEKSKPKSKKCTKFLHEILLKFVHARRRFIQLIYRGSGRLSDVLFDYSWASLVIFSTICLALSSGFFVASMEEDVYKLYSLSDSTSVDNAKQIAKSYTANRANFIMFTNPDENQDLFADHVTLSGLWAIDKFVRQKLTIPSVIHESEFTESHIWSFLDTSADEETMGYLRFPDVCALRPTLNRGLESQQNLERKYSTVHADDEQEVTQDLSAIEDDDLCDYTTATSAWRYPVFRRRQGSETVPLLLKTRNYPFFATAWNRRVIDLSLLFFSPTYTTKRDPRTGEPVLYFLDDATGMMFLYFTEICEEGKVCLSIDWERALISLVSDIRSARINLLASPQTGKSPLIWIDEFGAIVKSAWHDTEKYCSDDSGVIFDQTTGSIVCTSDDPNHYMIIDARHVDIAVYGANSWRDELARSTNFDMELMIDYIVSFLILLVFGTFNCVTRSYHRSKAIAGAAMAINGLLGYIGGAGMCYLFGLKHTATMNAVPFLTMGISMDDTFVMLNAYSLCFYLEAEHPNASKDDRDDPIAISRKRCRIAMSESSLAITLTTFTNIIAFASGIISPYAACRNFCIVCLWGIAGGYIGSFLFFWPVVCILSRIEHSRESPNKWAAAIYRAFGINTTCEIPVKTDKFLNMRIDQFDAGAVLESNEMVVKRHTRVIRLENELSRREFINTSVNIAHHFKSACSFKKREVNRVTSSFQSSNLPVAGSDHLSPSLSNTDDDLTISNTNRNRHYDFTITDEPNLLTCVNRLPPPYDHSISADEHLNSRVEFTESLVDTANFENPNIVLDPEHHDYLEKMLKLAREDYEMVKPTQGLVFRHARAAAVRFISTTMRRAVFRWGMIALFTGFLIWMILEIKLNLKKGLEQLNLVPPDSYLKDAYLMSAKNEIYLVEGQLAFFMQPGASFSEVQVRQAYQNLNEMVIQKPYIRSTLDPIKRFEMYLEEKIGTTRDWDRVDNSPDSAEPKLFDGIFEPNEYERALLFWNINRGEGAQMNRFLVWNRLDAAEDGDDMPWLSDSKSTLTSVLVIYFNDFYPEVDEQSKAFQDLRKDIAVFNNAHGDELKAYEYNSLHPFFESDEIIVKQTLSSMSGSLIGIGIVTALLMDSDHILHPNSVLVFIILLCVDVSMFGLMSLFGIKLNIITMILLIMSTGFSVDYSLHTAHTYAHMSGDLLQRMAMTMTYIGLPLFQGVISTFIASLPLTTRMNEYIYATFFEMCAIVLFAGFVYGVFLLPQALVILDRLKGEMEAEPLRVLVHNYKCEIDAREHQSFLAPSSSGEVDLAVHTGWSANWSRISTRSLADISSNPNILN